MISEEDKILIKHFRESRIMWHQTHQTSIQWIMPFGLSFSNMYETRVHDIDELRQHLLHVWHGLGQSLIDDAVDQWPMCLCSCQWRTF